MKNVKFLELFVGFNEIFIAIGIIFSIFQNDLMNLVFTCFLFLVLLHIDLLIFIKKRIGYED